MTVNIKTIAAKALGNFSETREKILPKQAKSKSLENSRETFEKGTKMVVQLYLEISKPLYLLSELYKNFNVLLKDRICETMSIYNYKLDFVDVEKSNFRLYSIASIELVTVIGKILEKKIGDFNIFNDSNNKSKRWLPISQTKVVGQV